MDLTRWLCRRIALAIHDSREDSQSDGLPQTNADDHEYFEFGNDSGEVAAVWSGGRMILPPTELSPGAAHGPEGGPILIALKALGADVDPHRDTIDNLGSPSSTRRASGQKGREFWTIAGLTPK